jgi:hypothetical protein
MQRKKERTIKGSCDATRYRKKPREKSMVRVGLIRNMQGGQAMPEQGQGSDEACKLAYTVVKSSNTVQQ